MKAGRKKGTQKTGGRSSGTLNRTTKEAHELFVMIMNRQMDRVETALKNIDDDEKYINALAKLFQYYIPKKTDITSDDKPIKFELPVINITTKHERSN